MIAAQHRRALSQLAELPALRGPKFTFCHLITPHPPYVFTREGREDWNIDQTSRDSYIDQVIYLNHEVTRTIDSILAKSTMPPMTNSFFLLLRGALTGSSASAFAASGLVATIFPCTR